MTVAPLDRRSTVDALAAALRARILDGDLPGGARLREQDLSAAYDVARHTVRAALRALQAEGLVAVEPHRGARVAALDAPAVQAVYELRAALETEAARLALERHDGRLPDGVHAAAARLAQACRRARPRWSTVVDAHEATHDAIVAASRSPRIVAAHRALAAETRLFVVQLRPTWTYARMAVDHLRLVADLERDGPDALRHHLRDGAATVLGLLGEGGEGGPGAAGAPGRSPA